MKVKLGPDSIRILAAFEKITKVDARDCILTEDTICFLVNPDKVGLAIGKNGSNIKQVSRVLGKAVKVYAYSSDPEELVRNMIPNIKSYERVENSVTISIPVKDKVFVIGRNGRNIKIIKEILKRHFDIDNLKLR